MKIEKVTATAGKQEEYGERKAQVTYEATIDDEEEDVDSTTKALLNKARKHAEERCKQWRPENKSDHK